jgi:hypothetical protein
VEKKFLNFFSLKAAYLIPQLAIRKSGAWLDEQTQHYAYTLLTCCSTPPAPINALTKH